MFKLALFLSMLCCNIVWGRIQLTDDTESFRASLRALSDKIGIPIYEPSLDLAETFYQNLSSDPEYKNAHRLYRAQAAMTLAGDTGLLMIVDLIWQSGLSGDNQLLQVIGLQWSESAPTNDQNRKIYQSRFELELKRQSERLEASTTFARQEDWKSFSLQGSPSRYAQATSAIALRTENSPHKVANWYENYDSTRRLHRENAAKCVLWYAESLWSVVPKWHRDLFPPLSPKNTQTPSREEVETHSVSSESTCKVTFVAGENNATLSTVTNLIDRAFQTHRANKGKVGASVSVEVYVVPFQDVDRGRNALSNADGITRVYLTYNAKKETDGLGTRCVKVSNGQERQVILHRTTTNAFDWLIEMTKKNNDLPTQKSNNSRKK